MTASEMLAVLGLELSIRAYPAGEPIRDAAHAALLERFRSQLASRLSWQTEVPLPHAGDRRAWDAVVSGLDGDGRWRIGVEAEMRPTDIQGLERRLALKERDGGVDGVVLLLADTRHNRSIVRDHAGLRTRFPVAGRRALERLRVGARLEGSAIVLL